MAAGIKKALALAVCWAGAGLCVAQDAPAAAPVATAVTASADAGVQGGTIHGVVGAGEPGKPGFTPLPGVAVTATNTLTGRKFAAATDIDGNYAMSIAKNGRYVVRAEFMGFAAATVEVVLTGDLAATIAHSTSFGMQLASRAEATEAKAAAADGSSTSLARGLQGLSLSGNTATDASGSAGNTGVTMPALAGLGDSITGGNAAAGVDSIAVSGQAGQMNGLANFSEDDVRQRIQEAVDRAKANGSLPAGGDPTNAIVGMIGNMMGGGGGGRGGGGGGGGRGGGSGAFRGFNPAQTHGGVNYSGEFAALDSAPWSPTLQPVQNPSYAKNSYGATLAGSPYIPGLTKPSTKQFVFLNLNGQRNTTPQILLGTVPTTAERGGDFTGQLPIYDPTTGMPFAGNNLASRITPQAAYVLAHYYPKCNVAGCDTGTLANNYNYQTITTAGQNSTNLAARYVRNFGQDAGNPFARQPRGAKPTLRQNINANFSYSHSASDQRNIFLGLGGASLSDGYNFGAGYTVGYGRFNNTFNVNWNRSHSTNRNYFTDTADNPAQDAGIAVPSAGAIGFRTNFYNGLPSLQLNQYQSLSNTNPNDAIGQTISFSESVSWRKNKHNMKFGVDVRRVHQDSLGGSNPLGTLVFTGFNTESKADQASTNGIVASGNSFADFLLGLPQQSKIQAGLSKIYLRENVFDAYAQDDHRVTDNITLNYGLRYEYFAPFTEKNGRLVNLTGVSTGTTSVSCLTPNGGTVVRNAVTGETAICAAGPTASLIHPDRAMYSPRFGVAWHPKFLKETVIRAGYGLNFNTAQFSTFAKLLSYQAPFATVQNNVLGGGTAGTTGCTNANLTLASGFGCSNRLYQNSFAVDPNYRLGVVQVYNVDIQKTVPWGVVLNIGYNGSKGANLDVTRAPNHNANGVTTPDAVAFTYEDSIAASNFNALTLNAHKRLQHGIAVGATYQYAHSIDDASSIGGGSSTSSIQNDADLQAERGNSSFDVRHKLTGDWTYELPVGPNRMFLNKGGWVATALDGFSLSGDFTFASGTYYTPSIQATAAEIEAGGTYTQRPNRVFSQPLAGSGAATTPQNQGARFFNTAAFASPSGYGSASRYSIEGPGQVVVDAALSRTVTLGDTRSLETRMSATNVFNTVQYNGINTTFNSLNFGQVSGAAAMRKIVFTARYRF